MLATPSDLFKVLIDHVDIVVADMTARVYKKRFSAKTKGNIMKDLLLVFDVVRVQAQEIFDEILSNRLPCPIVCTKKMKESQESC